jgi:hypothetical protein
VDNPKALVAPREAVAERGLEGVSNQTATGGVDEGTPLRAKVAPILSVLNLGSEGIRYFAGSVARMRTTNMRRRADENIHVHLVASIAHQYYRLHDNLVDVLLTSVQTFENVTLREHRDWCFDERKRHEHATEILLDDLDASVFFLVLRQIREAVSDDLLSNQEKVTRIGLLVRPEQTAETINGPSGERKAYEHLNGDDIHRVSDMRVDELPRTRDRDLPAMADLECSRLKSELTREPRPDVMGRIAALGDQRVHQGPRRCQIQDEFDTRARLGLTRKHQHVCSIRCQPARHTAPFARRTNPTW